MTILWIFLFLFNESIAWWDEGHMLIGAIASIHLDQPTKQKVENALSAWDEIYPGMSTIPSAAVWADHIKCSTHSRYCSGLPLLDGFEAFNAWHYIALPYNPQNLTLDLQHEMATVQMSGAPWALSTLFSSLTGIHTIRIPGLNKINNKVGAPIENRRHKKHATQLSVNLSLRLIIHIMGDVHQPLHCSEGVSTQWPNGDSGGTKIHVDNRCIPTELKEWSEFVNLHALWDTAGGLFCGLWNELDEDRVTETAHTLNSKFAKELKDDPLELIDFFGMAKETHEIATLYARTEFDFSNPVQLSDHFYCPSENYIKKAREVGARQIVKAGIRLAKVLTSISENLDLVETFPTTESSENR
eukprot:GHVP01005878.1.p1 GENE.GHVP01005878.1~~GHVP01005878.1.p1  ORF type:complete len:357 (+),score=49.00 GHVP01005878.1:1205-2275(+)